MLKSTETKSFLSYTHLENQVKSVSNSALSLSKRFSLVLICAIGLFISWYLSLDLMFLGKDKTYYAFTALTFALGIPLFTALQLFWEKYRINWKYKIVMVFLAMGYLYIFWIQALEYNLKFAPPAVYFYKWAAAFLALNGMISFSIFHKSNEVNDFWNFNCLTFIRLLTGALYSGVLFLGLGGALLAIDQLFNFKIKPEFYGKIFVFLVSIYFTFYVLGGIKKDINEYKANHFYPKGLKLFTVYVLIPLILIYLLILYAYGVKILLQWELPKGWVSQLILWYSILGTLAFLLVYPLRESTNNNWVKRFTRLFYFAIVPLLVLLFIAIYERINTYGVTIERYIVLVLAIWLAVITLYFLLSKKDNIIYYPLSLTVVFLFCLMGPWSIDQLPANSQIRKLKTIIENPNKINVGSSIVNYLANNHSFQFFRNLHNSEVDKILPTHANDNSRYYYSKEILKVLKLEDTTINDFKSTYLTLGYHNYLIATNINDLTIINFSFRELPANAEKDGYKIEISNGELIYQYQKSGTILFSLNHIFSSETPMPVIIKADSSKTTRTRAQLIINELSAEEKETLQISDIRGSIIINNKE